MRRGYYVYLVNLETKCRSSKVVYGSLEDAQKYLQNLNLRMIGRPNLRAFIGSSFAQMEDTDYAHVDVKFKVSPDESIDDLRQKVYALVEGTELIWRYYVDEDGNDIPESNVYTLDILPQYVNSALMKLRDLPYLVILSPWAKDLISALEVQAKVEASEPSESFE